MDHEIDDYFKNGILFPTIEAQRNIYVWKKIADEYDFLIYRDHEIQKFYGFIQASAVTNFILYTSKLYDTPNKSYPTMCIISFLNLIRDKAKMFSKIVEVPSVEDLLNKYDVSKVLKDSLTSDDPSEFPLEFYTYYMSKFESIKDRINILKSVRDKVIAHNERLEKELNELSLEIIEELLDLAIEIISIYSMAYNSTFYGDKENNAIKRDADLGTYFIQYAIDNLKK